MQYDLPELFISRMRKQLDQDFEPFRSSLDTASPVSIRLNPAKPTNHLKMESPVPWCRESYYLSSRPKFTLDPLFHAGTYYVQEASSMAVGHALRSLLDLTQALKVLDLSAAPGGKSTLINSIISRDSVLVANEVISKRNSILQENLARWGYDNTIITRSDPKYFQKLPELFDLILVDAPCSGEGLFRKDPGARTEWSEDNVQLCAARQRRILADIFPSLAPGGLLMYSTCTFSEAENEENVKWLLDQSDLVPVSLDFPASWGVETQDSGFPGYRFYPHRVEGEGFYLAVLQRKSKHPASNHMQRSTNDGSSAANPEDGKWLQDPERYRFLTRDKHRYAIPQPLIPLYEMLEKVLRINSAGIHMGKLYPNGLQPAPELAFSIELSEAVPRLELDREAALDYLSHRQFAVDGDIPPSRYLLTHGSYGLGWINKLANGQVRNNYPAGWRILNR